MMLLLAVCTFTTAWAGTPPVAGLEQCYGGAGFILVDGWAYDKDDPGYSIYVNVYIYTDEACTHRYGDIHRLEADQLIDFAGDSPHNLYSGYHAFYDRIPVGDPGDYWVKIIAVDIYNETSQVGDVTAVNVSPVAHSITVANPAEGGTVESSVASSILDQTITLTATPADGYVLTGITVTYGDNSSVPVTDGLWYTGNTASFTMPNADVTVTPTFAYMPTDLSVNMPVTDDLVINVPPCVTTFKVYDDGGPDGDYSNFCSGHLKVNAPEGKVIQFTGTVTTDNSGHDELDIYYVIDDLWYRLIEQAYSIVSGVAVSIPTKVSGGNSATIYFGSNTSECAAGLDLTLTILPAPTGTADLSQCTPSVPTHILWDNLNRDTYINKSIFVTDPNGVVLTRNTDYELSIELENGETVPINYRYPDPNDPYGACYLRPGILYNETLIITGTGNYTGTLRVPYKKFRLSLDGKGYLYLINSTRDLEYFTAAVNSGLYVYNSYSSGFLIGNDLAYDPSELTVDLDGDGTPDSNYTPIGTAEHPFVGVFYGNGQTYHWHTDEEIAADPHCPSYIPDPLTERTVSGIVCTAKNAPAGLFGYIGEAAKVSDMTLSDCQFTASGTGVAGAIAATVASTATVERCLVMGSTVSGTTKGAIVANNSGTLSRNYYTDCNSNASNIGTAAGDVDGARRDVGLTVPVSLSLDEDTADGLAFGGNVYGGTGETLTFYEDTFDAYSTTGPVASFTHVVENYQYTLAINNDAAAAITINHANHFGTDDGADGSEEHPYVITTTEGLDFLAELVNGDPYTSKDAYDEANYFNSRYKFSGKYFKLGADIEYNPNVLTIDTDGNIETKESNYTPIGGKLVGANNDQYTIFFGSFDGDGHTISGIRVNNPTADYQGIFGTIGVNYAPIGFVHGTVKNLTVSNVSITGAKYVGGIAGNMIDVTLTNCHAVKDGDNTVTIQATSRGGGLIGIADYGTISYCTSAATVNGGTEKGGMGGIVGNVSPLNCTMNHNLAIGVIVSGGTEANGMGAIAGTRNLENHLRDHSFAYNYYYDCTIGDDPINTPNRGSCVYVKINGVYQNSYSSDINTEANPDGIVFGFVLYDNGTDNASIISENNGQTKNVILFGRTLRKDGTWNTLCLPFDVVVGSGQLEDATAMTFNASTSGFDSTKGELSLYFEEVTEGNTIAAGTPFIVKWESDTESTKGTADTELRSPVFSGVTINDVNTDDVTSTDGKVSFLGNFSPVALTGGDRSNLCLGTENQLYWPSANGTLNAFRAYLHVDGMVQAIQGEPALAFLGDVNCNGGIDIGDAVCIVNYLVNKLNTSFNPAVADLNGNGGIDIGDAVMIVNILVGKTNTPSAAPLMTTEEGLQTTDYNEPQ